MGKIHLQRNLCRYASQLKTMNPEAYSDLDILFFQWNADVSRVEPQDDGDIPPLAAQGPSDLAALADFLRAARGDDGRALRVLVLSDGNFSKEDIAGLAKERDRPPGLLLRTVAVGADANLSKLAEIASNGRFYLAEDIAAAVDEAAFGSDEPVIPPESANQIKFPPTSSEEDDLNA